MLCVITFKIKNFFITKEFDEKINLKRARIKIELENTVNMIKKEAHVQLRL